MIKKSAYRGTDAELVHEIQELCCKKLEGDMIPFGYKLETRFPVKTSGKRDMEKIRSDRAGFVLEKGGGVKKRKYHLMGGVFSFKFKNGG